MPTPNPGTTIRQLAERDERVFSSYPQVGRYFPAAAIEAARKRLGRAIERGDGPGLVIGAPGTGKSLLLQVLAAQYHDRFDVVLLVAARLCTRRALLQTVLFELGLPYKLRDEGELRLSLLDHLLSADESTSGLLLLVDEAQTLPVPLLDELRVMTNLVRGDRPRVRLVLAGNSTLEESFAHPELESFSQRLSARCYLAPLKSEETKQYIRAQLAASQAAADQIFATDAWEALFDATDGVPRLVNQLCDRALQFAAADAHASIDRELVQRAWSDLQQLPTSWDIPRTTTVASHMPQVVEFGQLLAEPANFDQSRQDDVIEPTELDCEDETLDSSTEYVGNAQPVAVDVAGCVDPFDEKFEDEVVVLDNFAAWNNVFGHATIRVENRRDPGFATLVQNAMAESFSSQAKSIESSAASLRTHAAAEPTNDVDEPASEEHPDWPPLRLARLSDSAPLNPVPLMPPSASIDETVAAWDKLMTAIEISQGTGKWVDTRSPVLLVDEESSPGKPAPPVRCQAYRNLFSRLRSG